MQQTLSDEELARNEGVARRLFDAAGQLMALAIDRYNTQLPEEHAALLRRLDSGVPLGVTVLCNRLVPVSCKVCAPDGNGGTIELMRLDAVPLSTVAN